MGRFRLIRRIAALAGETALALVVAVPSWSAEPAPSSAAQRADAIMAELKALSEKPDPVAARALADQASRTFAGTGEAALAADFALEAMKFDHDLQEWERIDREFRPRLEDLLDLLDAEQDEAALRVVMDAE